MATDRLETIVSLAKRRGFVYPSSEIYGGLRAAWDYGPLGIELKNNVKRQWWKSMVTGRDDVVGLDSCVILAREVWEASGHVSTFSDRSLNVRHVTSAIALIIWKKHLQLKISANLNLWQK